MPQRIAAKAVPAANRPPKTASKETSRFSLPSRQACKATTTMVTVMMAKRRAEASMSLAGSVNAMLDVRQFRSPEESAIQ